METSPSGALILQGKGLQSVHDHIQAAFEVARTDIPTDIRTDIRTEIDIEIVEDTEIDRTISETVQLVEVDEEAEVELVELDEEADAEACLRDAAQAVQQEAVRENYGGVYLISVPTEDAATLIEQALRLI